MDIVGTVGGSLVSAIVFLSIVFTVAWLKNGRYDLIDSAWGPTFIVVVGYALFTHQPIQSIMWVAAAMVLVWGCRLSWHIFRRWRRSKEEDPRYKELRAKWPQRFVSVQVFARIYIVQALLAVGVSLPVIVIMVTKPAWSVWVIAGMAVWLVGFIIEVVADRQLRAFLVSAEGNGGLMTSGLWRYSRHPNYFGEITLWCGLALMASGTRFWWVGWFGALLITTLIIFISGIPPAERRARMKKGWEAYRRRTSVLLPLPPRQ